MDVTRHFLVTAGNTREMIDRVRDWGNIFTGKTGLDIALALLDLGDVTLLTSNQAHAAAHDGYRGRGGMLGVETFRTHAELRGLLEERVPAGGIDGIFMTAAVSDYAPRGVFKVLAAETLPDGTQRWHVQDVQAEKVKSSHGRIAILGEATEKLVDQFRTRWHYRGLLVKFKLEVGLTEEELIRVASESRVASGADYIVANTLAMVEGQTGQAGGAGAYVIGEKLCERVGRAQLAERMRQLAEGL